MMAAAKKKFTIADKDLLLKPITDEDLKLKTDEDLGKITI